MIFPLDTKRRKILLLIVILPKRIVLLFRFLEKNGCKERGLSVNFNFKLFVKVIKKKTECQMARLFYFL